MGRRISIGLKSIKIGAVELDGGMGTTLAALDGTFQGSASITQADGETTEFYIEEQDDPIEIVSKQGAITVEFSIVDLTPATLKKVLGGEITGVGDSASWSAPAEAPAIEQSIEIISLKNVKYEITRAKIEAKLDVKLSKKEMAVVVIKATVLSPTKEGEAKMKISQVA
ncbi:MAG: hypothetical protein KGZ82_04215 [Bacteroidales bacterium]|nr:hypothetical protein [Bacteroidales bacterium]